MLGERNATLNWQFSTELRSDIEQRIEAIKQGAIGWLSEDRSALMVDGGPMYCCFISPEGDTFIEHYWTDDNLATRVDRSRRAQIETLVLGARNLPALAELLPTPNADSAMCEACSGKGFVSHERSKIKEPVFLCMPCSGLGWVSADVFQEPSDSDQSHHG